MENLIEELYEDELKSPGRRKFLKDIIKYGPPVLYAISQFIACKDNGSSPFTPPIDKPATEIEGREAMKEAAISVMGEKGYTYEIKNDVNLYTNKSGRYDVGVFADRNNDGQHDLVLGMNYITDGESRQNLNDTATYKLKEIVKTDLTTKEYLTEEFKKWMRDVA